MSNPRFTPDELVFLESADNIVSSNGKNTIKDLGVTEPTSLHNAALGLLRTYRMPSTMNLVD